MNFTEAANAIEKHFESNWTETSVHYPNSKFKLVKEFVRLTTLFGESAQISLGSSPDTRNPGVVIFSIFVEPGKGLKRAMSLADSIKSIFDKQDILGLRFKTVRVAILGETESYYQVNVSCPFYFDTQS